MSQNQNRIHEVFPYLRVKGAPAAIDFYKKVFGATERFRLTEHNGCRLHPLGTLWLK